MIHLPDPGLEQRANQSLHIYQKAVNRVATYAKRVATGKKLFSRYNKVSNRTFQDVRKSLTRMCSGAQRCVYCEDSVGDEVEHIQPKDLYPCLVFSWSNFVYACGRCNGSKNNKFAVISKGRLIDVTRKRGAPVTPPLQGTPAFLSPRLEEPLDFLELDLAGTFFVIARDGLSNIDYERAEFTINTLKLNRDVLCHARGTAFYAYKALLHEYVTKRSIATHQQLRKIENALKSTTHPTVWEEMKRKRSVLGNLNLLFTKAPESLNW